MNTLNHLFLVYIVFALRRYVNSFWARRGVFAAGTGRGWGMKWRMRFCGIWGGGP